MKINTNQFGELEFDENKIINFKEGLIGFENLKNFILLNPQDGLFLWLTSVDEPEIVFPLFPIKALYDDFPNSVGFETFGIVKLDKNIGNITINLLSPVYISEQMKSGYQFILDDDRYSITYKLFKKD
jgi:flagellar assembly factor FliW